MISDLLFERSMRIGNRRGRLLLNARFSKLKDLCTSLDNWLVVGEQLTYVQMVKLLLGKFGW